MYSVRILTLFNIHYRATDTCLDTMLVHNIQDGIKRRTQVGTPGKGMLKSSRDGTLRLSKKGLCVFCDTSVTSYKGSTGDHIIPTIEGGQTFSPVINLGTNGTITTAGNTTTTS